MAHVWLKLIQLQFLFLFLGIPLYNERALSSYLTYFVQKYTQLYEEVTTAMKVILSLWLEEWVKNNSKKMISHDAWDMSWILLHPRGPQMLPFLEADI